MRIGVSYNLWKGEELLPYSIKSIRNEVDYIVVVYQNQSNYQEHRFDLLPFLTEMLSAGLIDEIVPYKPHFQGVERKFWGTHNELIKRNLGLQKCVNIGCSHLIDLDVDEIYETSAFIKARDKMLLGDFDASFVLNTTYYKYPNCIITPPEKKYTPFMYKIDRNSKFEPIENDMFPVITDGKRRIKNKHPYIFTREELVLHHFSYVRFNDLELKSKFKNCSSNMNFSEERIDKIIDDYNNFSIGNEVVFGKDEVYKTLQVENLFNIKL